MNSLANKPSCQKTEKKELFLDVFKNLQSVFDMNTIYNFGTVFILCFLLHAGNNPALAFQNAQPVGRCIDVHYLTAYTIQHCLSSKRIQEIVFFQEILNCA